MKSKVFLFIGLIAILSNFIIESNDQQCLEEVGKIDNVDQVVISEKMATEIKEILNKEIKQLTDQKAFLQGFFYKYFAPTLYGVGGLAIAAFQISSIGSRIKFLCKTKHKFSFILFLGQCLLGMKGKEVFIGENSGITLPLALILLQKKLLNAARNHKQKTAEKIQTIDAEIARNQAIVAQLQQQQQ